MGTRDEAIVSQPVIDPAPRPQLKTDAVRCCASDLLHWAGMGDAADAKTDQLSFATRRVGTGTTLMYEGHLLQNLYFVGAGSFKIVQVDIEGYEQVLGFALRGDCIGLDALSDGRHASSAIALEDSMVCVVPFRELVALGHEAAALERLLHHATGAELLRRGRSQYLMAAACAEVRVARFLINYGLRQGEMGYSDRHFRLRMSRRDIASYLGVAHETVSRALTLLAQWGIIVVDHRDVEIVDGPALHNLQRLTRGVAHGAARAGLVRQAGATALAA
jgi:CRP/FNR family transcriptional regulator